MDRSLGFGSTARNCSPCSDSVSLRLRDSYPLTSLRTVTRRLILQKARHHRIAPALTACKSTVSGSLSLPSRGSFHLSLTVLCAIGHHIVFRLGGWSPLLPAGFLVSCGTLVPAGCLRVSCTGLSPSLEALSNALLLPYLNALSLAHNPRKHALWFGLFPFRSPLLRKSMFLSLPPGT